MADQSVKRGTAPPPDQELLAAKSTGKVWRLGLRRNKKDVAKAAACVASATAFGVADPLIMHAVVAGEGVAVTTATAALIGARGAWLGVTWVNSRVLANLGANIERMLLPDWLRKRIQRTIELDEPDSSAKNVTPADLEAEGITISVVIDPASDLGQISSGTQIASEFVTQSALAAGSVFGIVIMAPGLSLPYVASVLGLAGAYRYVAPKISALDDALSARRQDWSRRIHKVQDGAQDIDTANGVEVVVGDMYDRYAKLLRVRTEALMKKSKLGDMPFLAGNVLAFPLTYLTAHLSTGIPTNFAEVLMVTAAGAYATTSAQRAMGAAQNIPELRNSVRRVLKEFIRTDHGEDIAGARDIDPNGNERFTALELVRPQARYPGSNELAVDLSESQPLRVPRKSRLLVVGPNGAGKSTLLDGITRRHELAGGEIFVFGTNIREATRHSLRENVRFHPQSIVLFPGTIEDNIRLGSPDTPVPQQSIDEVFHRLGLASGARPLRLNQQMLTNDGALAVSSGQAARIALARTIKDINGPPKILLLDEAAAALDAESKQKMESVIDYLQSKGWTVVQVIHRLGDNKKRWDLQEAEQSARRDRIAVLENGKLVQLGYHGSLVRDEKGLYNRLVQSELNGTRKPEVQESSDAAVNLKDRRAQMRIQILDRYGVAPLDAGTPSNRMSLPTDLTFGKNVLQDPLIRNALIAETGWTDEKLTQEANSPPFLRSLSRATLRAADAGLVDPLDLASDVAARVSLETSGLGLASDKALELGVGKPDTKSA